MEGRATATRLADAGIQVVFETDVSLFSQIEEQDLVVLGADQIGERSFVNKMGTKTVVARATDAGKPVWVLGDTTKFLPRGIAAAVTRLGAKPQPTWQVWRTPPRGVEISNEYFERTHYRSSVRLLTECGWMTQAEVRGELKKVHISPRLKHLAD